MRSRCSIRWSAGQRTRADGQERREHHADAHHRGRSLRELAGHQPSEAAERDHDESEFAGLRQQDRRFDRHARATPNRRQAAYRTKALIASRSATASRMVPIPSQTMRTSIVMPTVMKNSPTSNPLNGAMSIST